MRQYQITTRPVRLPDPNTVPPLTWLQPLSEPMRFPVLPAARQEYTAAPVIYNTHSIPPLTWFVPFGEQQRPAQHVACDPEFFRSFTTTLYVVTIPYVSAWGNQLERPAPLTRLPAEQFIAGQSPDVFIVPLHLSGYALSPLVSLRFQDGATYTLAFQDGYASIVVMQDGTGTTLTFEDE